MRREPMTTEGCVPGAAPRGETEGILDGGQPFRPSRRGFLGRTATAAAGAAAAGLVVATPGTAHAAVPQLYPGQNRRIFQELLNDENSHANFLVGTLGGNARPRPVFQNLIASNVNQFVAQAIAFENISARSYVGALPYVNDPGAQSSVARIALVEGRHAGVVDVLLNQTVVPAGLAFELPMSVGEMIADTSHFVNSLNGGSTPTYDQSRSASNDIAILNFLLFIEFLESQFYNINVPKFFG